MSKLKAGKKAPQIVFRGEEPSAVILDIEVYQEMLEQLEDFEYFEFIESEWDKFQDEARK